MPAARLGSVDAPAPAAQFDDVEQQRVSASLGMWIFLTTEVLLFGAIFTAFAVHRYRWPDATAAASSHLDVTLGALNTAVLLTSGFTMALAVRAAALGKRRAVAVTLAVTALLGAAFLGIKALEYSREIDAGLLPGATFRWTGSDAGPVQLFFVLYFLATSLHALHLATGIAMIAFLLVRQIRGRDIPVEVPGLYWHFIDVVWIFLFPLLYLAAGR